MKRYAYLIGYFATVPLANFMISNVGTECIPNGPCIIPVGFGLTAPSGVLMVGAALVLRDKVQDDFGPKTSFAALMLAFAVSYLIANPYVAIASATAFLFSELSDFGIYTYLREKSRELAIAVSGLVGALLDSAIFLFIAFGSLEFIAGQVLAKGTISIAVAAFLKFRKR